MMGSAKNYTECIKLSGKNKKILRYYMNLNLHIISNIYLLYKMVHDYIFFYVCGL